MKYSLEELHLFAFVVRCFDSGQYFTGEADGCSETSSDDDTDTSQSTGTGAPHIRNGIYCINLTPAQIEVIKNLNNHLAKCAYNSRGLQDAIDALVEALYMPDNADEMLANVFTSPVAAWMCLRSLVKGGGFAHPKLITGKLVGGQCGICLCIFTSVMKKWCQRREAGKNASETEGDWFQ
jgi:hypothetical protein